jgi:hypothetical protein
MKGLFPFWAYPEQKRGKGVGVWGRELGPLVPPPVPSGRDRIFGQNFSNPDLRQGRFPVIVLPLNCNALLERHRRLHG